MRVVELAADLKVPTEALLTLLRGMGIPVADGKATVSDADVARVLARVERERRAGKKDARDAVMAAIEEAQTGTRRRRRRRAPEPEPEEAPSEEEPAEPEATAETTTHEGETEEGEVEAEPVTVPAGEAAEEEAREAETEAAGPEPEPEAEAVRPREPEPEAAQEGEGEPAEPEAKEPAEERPKAEAAEEQEPAATAETEPEEGAAPEPEEAEPEEEAQPEGEAEERSRPRRKVPKPAASAGPGGQVRIQAEGYTSDGKRKKEKKKGKKRQRVDQDAVQDNIQRVMAEIKGGGGKRRKKGRGSQPSREEREEAEAQAREEKEQEAKTVRVNEFLTVAELSELIDVPSTEIVGAAFKNLGMMVTINQRLDFDQIELLLEEFNFKAVREEEYGEETEVAADEAEEDPSKLQPRPPVVTVMGHVDHGKTLLLDHIRKENVVAGESGGITQHIGAYHVEVDDGRTITFLDTPGHAAFTAMRARGADVTDVVVLVVAADDSIMPQTVEAISHAQNAGVPVIVAVNKMDLPAANAGRVRQELLQHGVTVEEFGGEVLDAEISAKTGQGVDDLLEKILLQAELLELKANPEREALGIVIEAKLDVGKGPVVTVLVRHGTLRVGDDFICGKYDGRVRALLDERGKSVEEVGPGIPVQVLGSPGVPQAGDAFQVMAAEKAAEIANTRQRLEREKQLRIKERGVKLGDFSALLEEGETATLPLIIKGDVDGSVQAVSDALEQLSTEEVRVEVIHRGVGAVNESDVLLAQTAGAVVIGFRVRPDTNARHLAEREGVDIHTYDVIYEAVDEVRSALEGMLAPERKEKVMGAAEVREVFRISKVGTVAGCYVTDGVIDRKGEARVIRDGVVVYTGDIASLKRFKDDVREVREGFECGIDIANFNDVKVGDMIECFVVEEVARTLATSGAGEKS